jgi:hypothetical protein
MCERTPTCTSAEVGQGDHGDITAGEVPVDMSSEATGQSLAPDKQK